MKRLLLLWATPLEQSAPECLARMKIYPLYFAQGWTSPKL